MDRYEFNLKLEQIKKLAAKKDYKGAARIANQIDCRKVKDWATIATIINVLEAAGYYDDARDVAILAYERNQGGRKLVYKLADLLIRLGQLRSAEEIYEEYVHMAPRDVNRYKLEYKLRKAQNANVNTLISILEQYHALEDTDEKYAYELAQLYSYAGMSEKCVRICDDIILMFRDGDYVANAIQLKQRYVSITNTQQLIYDEAVKRTNPDDEEQTKEIRFAKARERASLDDEMDAELEDRDQDAYGGDNLTVGKIMQESFRMAGEEPEETDPDAPSLNLVQNKADVKTQNFFKALIGHVMEKSAKDDRNRAEGYDDSDLIGYDEIPDEAVGDSSDENEYGQHGDSASADGDDMSDEKSKAYDDGYDDANPDMPQAEYADAKDGNETGAQGGGRTRSIEDAKKSLDDLISNARNRLESNYENVVMQHREDDIATTAENIKVPLDNAGLYDTRNIQAEIARGVGEVLGEDDVTEIGEFKTHTRDLKGHIINEDKVVGREEPVDENAQIEGQMNLADWMDSVNEEKYGNRATKEFSKAQLEHELALRESKEEAYDRLMAKQKDEARKKGQPFDEEAAKAIARQQLVLQAVKTDLAIRTGKATAGLEADAKLRRDDDKIWLFNYRKESRRLAAEAEKTRELSAAEAEKTRELSAAEAEKVRELSAAEAEKVRELSTAETAPVTQVTDNVADDTYSDGNVTDTMQALGATAHMISEGDLAAQVREAMSKDDEDSSQEGFDEDYQDDVYSDDGYADDEMSESEDDWDDEPSDGEYDREYDEDYPEDEEYGRVEEEEEEYSDEDFLEEDDEPKSVRDLLHFGHRKGKKAESERYEEPDDYEDEEEEEPWAPEIPHEVRKFFGKYGEMDGVTAQLAEYFEVAGSEMGRKTSSTGNIIIGGNRSSDKVGLAKNLARALIALYPNQLKNIAKTTGKSINERGIIRSLSKLRSTVFIIEDAGQIQPKRITELLSVMDQDTGGMIVILTDSDTELGVLLSVNPDLTDNFNHRITIKQYAVAELVELARKYATKRQYVVNDDALTSLYMKINNMNKEYDYVRTDDVKEVIDMAIMKAERRASKRLFGRHTRRGGEYFVLTEADFKE